MTIFWSNAALIIYVRILQKDKQPKKSRVWLYIAHPCTDGKKTLFSCNREGGTDRESRLLRCSCYEIPTLSSIFPRSLSLYTGRETDPVSDRKQYQTAFNFEVLYCAVIVPHQNKQGPILLIIKIMRHVYPWPSISRLQAHGKILSLNN